jgi:hypothetical protein
MKKYLLGILVMIVGLVAGVLALAVGARAETGGVIMVHINQDFIAGGKAFSAGAYKVYQGSPQTGQWLILRSKETGDSVFLLPSTHDGTFPGQFEAKLTRAGSLYYLSEVVTDLGVYTLPAPHALTQTAKKKDRDKMAASGSNGAESAPTSE